MPLTVACVPVVGVHATCVRGMQVHPSLRFLFCIITAESPGNPPEPSIVQQQPDDDYHMANEVDR